MRLGGPNFSHLIRNLNLNLNIWLWNNFKIWERIFYFFNITVWCEFKLIKLLVFILIFLNELAMRNVQYFKKLKAGATSTKSNNPCWCDTH